MVDSCVPEAGQRRVQHKFSPTARPRGLCPAFLVCSSSRGRIPGRLARDWHQRVKSAMLHVVSLAQYAIAQPHGRYVPIQSMTPARLEVRGSPSPLLHLLTDKSAMTASMGQHPAFLRASIGLWMYSFHSFENTTQHVGTKYMLAFSICSAGLRSCETSPTVRYQTRRPL